MVQAGPTYDQDDSDRGQRPELRALDPPDEDVSGGRLQSAMRTLLESVNATYRQFSQSAEGFAREAMQVMEDLAASAAHSAGESREMAEAAGRAAEEARSISGALDLTVAAARDQFRADVESILDEAKPRIEEAVRAANDALDLARETAAGSAQRHDDAFQRMEASLQACRDAAQSAEAAAEAARRSADSIEQATAQARAGLHAEASRVDAETAERMEQSLFASQEAAAAAARAAEDARAAALEAMSHAAEAQQPAIDSGGIATQALLDRLEADYQLITELVQGLQARLTGLDHDLATPVAAAEPTEPPYELEEEAATWPPVLEASLVTEAPSPGWDASASEPVAEPADHEGAGRSVWSAVVTEPVGIAESAVDSPQMEGDAGSPAAPADPAWSESPHSDDPDATLEEWDVRAWTAPASPASVLEQPGAEDSPEWAAESAAAEAWAAESSRSRGWAETSSSSSDTAVDGGATWPRDDASETAPEPADQAGEAPLSLWSHPEYRPALTAFAGEEDGHSATEPPQAGAVAAEARILLTVAPVPDFDRLLTLDAALGKLAFVANVTLADYAREEVTFRIELNAAVSPSDFAAELSKTFGQSLDVGAEAPGLLALKVSGS